VLTTASLMVNGDAFEEAVQLARQHPSLGVGLHLTLVMGRATLPHEQIPGLTGSNGAFTDHAVAAGLNCFFKRSLRSQLAAEIGAQIDKFRGTGLVMDHLNGHLNFHLHPTIFRILVQQCAGGRQGRAPGGATAGTDGVESAEAEKEEQGVQPGEAPRREGKASFPSPREGIAGRVPPPFRLTRDLFWLNARLARGNWLYRISHAIIFNLLCARSRPVLRRLGIRHTDAVFGLLQNGRVTEEYLLHLLARLPAGDVEIYSHPCMERFPEEFAALTSPFVRGLTKKLGIQLCRYQDL
jgi:hypothetical protein